MCKTLFRIISFLLLALCMTAIFAFSAENAEKSSGTSGSLISSVAGIFINDFEELTEGEQNEIISGLQETVRTLAHFTIYTLLGFLASNSLVTFALKKSLKWVLPPVFCLLYAVSDEIHQYFVPGRSCQIIDIAVDTAGGVLGTALYALLIYIIIKLRKRKETENG